MGSYEKKVPYLIVDTSAFINSTNLYEIGENIITVPEVVNEIKSKRQLRRLIVLPYNLQIKNAFSENVKFVNEFSKKTGDFQSLSATDVKVIALTYQLEKEINGCNHLHNVPLHKATVQPFCSASQTLTNVLGFHHPKKSDLHSTKTCSNALENSLIFYGNKSDEGEKLSNAVENNLSASINSGRCLSFEEEQSLTEGLESLRVDHSSSFSDKFNGHKSITITEDNSHEHDSSDSSYCEEDECDWITPANLNLFKKRIADEVVEDSKGVNVACLTTDYAMQNVLKQIGLHVVSLDGKLIKQLRTFILRCYGCFKTTSIMTKVFCPNCGNKTLKKVAVSLNEDGTQHVHINFRKPLTAKGKRYSLPRPKGGKHSNNPILCEDTPVPQQKPTRLSKTKNNPLNDDYIAGFSPFVMRDVTSKSAMLGIKPYADIKRRMKRNPNENRRHKK